MIEQLTVDQWRERILAAWEKWGTGKPLDPRTVEHLAVEFAKPLEIPMKKWDWHKESPFVEFTALPPWPWDGYGFSSIRVDPDMPKNQIKLLHPDGRVDRIINIETGTEVK